MHLLDLIPACMLPPHRLLQSELSQRSKQVHMYTNYIFNIAYILIQYKSIPPPAIYQCLTSEWFTHKEIQF